MSKANKPSHRVYAVSRRDEKSKGIWKEIGAAWAHDDGKGLSLKLEFLPLNGGEIVLRVPLPKDEAQEASDTASETQA